VKRVLDRSDGTSLIEMLVVGFGVLLVTLPIMLMVVRMAEASDVTADEAKLVAMWVARHGQEPALDQRSEIHVSVVDGVVRVESSIDVVLVGIGGSAVGTTVTSKFEMPISPYRSRR